MEDYLTVEWITKASWATLALVFEDSFLCLWEGFAKALSIRSGASSSWQGQERTLVKECPESSFPLAFIGHSVL